jgi:Endosomal/lysosomal potassium channel TMEM175
MSKSPAGPGCGRSIMSAMRQIAGEYNGEEIMNEPDEFISKGRLDAITDGVFAFAMTLLVVNLTCHKFEDRGEQHVS